MEKLLTLGELGLKYLFRYRRRYGFLLAALTFGFTVVTLITSARDGMYDNVYYAAQSHYSGDLVAVGYSWDSGQRYIPESEIDHIISTANAVGLNPQHTILRTTFDGTNGMVYYLGAVVPLRYTIGCDWDDEGEIFLFSKMNFLDRVDGSFGEDGIVLSSPVAEQLGTKIGDRVTLEIITPSGQRNTGQFIVRGIVHDSSFFGYYKAYISRISLNRLMVYNDGDSSIIGFFFSNRSLVDQKRRVLHDALADRNIGAIVYSRDELDVELYRSWEDTRIFLLTMPVYLTEISNLLGALNMVSYFLYGMMLIIILISAAVTYRLILHERTREMGVMRVMGFFGGDLRLILWIEIVTLGFLSFILGFALSLVLGWALGFLSFTWFPSFEIFLRNGRLTVLYLPRTMLINVALVFMVLYMAAFIPAFQASKKNLPGLLSGEPI